MLLLPHSPFPIPHFPFPNSHYPLPLPIFTTMPELSLVITVKNEEENIAPLMAAVHSALRGMDYEVILVDDGSTDQTKKGL